MSNTRKNYPWAGARRRVERPDPPGVPTIAAEASSRHLELVRGATKLLGSTVGLDDDARRLFVAAKIDGMKPALTRLLTPGLPHQAAMLLLRSSVNASPMYLFRTLPPDVTRAQANRFRDMVTDTMCKQLRFPPFASLPAAARLTVQLAVQHGGLGLVSAEPTLDAGYLSSVAASIQDNFLDGSGNRRHLLRPPDPPDPTGHGQRPPPGPTTQGPPPPVRTHSPANPPQPGTSPSPSPHSRAPLPSTAGAPVHATTMLPDQWASATARHTQQCLARLASQGVDPSHTCLTATVSQLVDRCTSGAPPKMQHLLMKSINKRQATEAKTLSQQDPRWAARLRSAAGPGACAWLTTLPTDEDTSMPDKNYRVAVQYLLGLDYGLERHSPAPRCCYCNTPMANDPWHPIHCTFQNSHGKSLQHNKICDLLHKFCLKAGLGATTIEATQYQQASGVKPDVMVPFPLGMLALDVSGSDPTASTYVAAAARRSLSCATAREASKNSHYADMRQRFQIEFLPFVFETHGALGPSAMAFIDRLSEYADRRPGTEADGSFKFQLLARVSVIIQTANAELTATTYSAS